VIIRKGGKFWGNTWGGKPKGVKKGMECPGVQKMPVTDLDVRSRTVRGLGESSSRKRQLNEEGLPVTAKGDKGAKSLKKT